MKKLFLFVISTFLLASCSPPNVDGGQPVVEDPIDFENVYFDNMILTYDGNSHILDEVRGAPEGTQITYTNRESYTDVGSYTATALLSKEGYNNKTLTATLTINKASFSDITFESASFDYDGEPHSIFVIGAPSFATVTYTNNGITDVGTYTVTATIKDKNYNTMTKTATMRIIGRQITGVALENSTVEYDGKSHSLEVTGEVPSGVEVVYTNNGKINSGTYTVTANLSGAGYEPLRLTATLTIEPTTVNKPGYFYDRAYIYDGQDHNVYVDSAPKGATITYRCLNGSGTNTFKNPGFYIVEATIKTDNNHISKKTATLTIAGESSFGTDNSKTPLTISENLKWDELYEALGNDNYTLSYLSGSYDVDNIGDDRPEDLLSDSFTGHSSGHIVACDGKEAYKHVYSLNSSSINNYYDYYKEVGDDIIHLHFDDSTYQGSPNKFPKAAFSETVAKYYSEDAFVALTKGENGEFSLGVDGDDYYNNVGYPFIENGVFIVLMEHVNPNPVSSGKYRYFYDIYKFYNIGNTTVNVPNNFLPSQNYIDEDMGIDECYYGGVRYCTTIFNSTSSNPKYFYTAHLYVDYGRAVYLKPGTYSVLPQVYDRKVEAIIYTNANRVYKSNQSGYNFRLFVDSNGDYQGEYSKLGSLSKIDIKSFINAGGTVEYYTEWHD